ncbi:MAG: hypothetical protein ACI9U2_005256 [Bradymonadia bacterium]|jgi:hypothetical protein
MSAAAVHQHDALIAAGLCIARGVDPHVDAGLGWLQAAIEILPVGVPTGVILDIGRILTGPAFQGEFNDWSASAHTGHARLDQALARYDEHVIGRLSSDRLLESATDAMARLSAEDQADGIAIVLDELLRRLGVQAPTVPAGAVRRLSRSPTSELRALGFAALSAADGPADDLADAYLALVDGARRLGTLLTPTEIYTLQNLHALRGAAQRLALRQITEAATRFGLPKRARRVRSKAGNVAVMPDDDATYPMGGYAALATTGGLSNLVSSELIYMDDDADIDAFAVRWASGELLKYTRDESVFRRTRRQIVLVCAADLDTCRVKDADAPAQRIVLALGALVAGIEALIRWLDRVALSIVVVFEHDGARDPLKAERALLGLRLRAAIDAGIVTFADAAPEGDVDIRLDAAFVNDDFDAPLRSALIGCL